MPATPDSNPDASTRSADDASGASGAQSRTARSDADDPASTGGDATSQSDSARGTERDAVRGASARAGTPRTIPGQVTDREAAALPEPDAVERERMRARADVTTAGAGARRVADGLVGAADRPRRLPPPPRAAAALGICFGVAGSLYWIVAMVPMLGGGDEVGGVVSIDGLALFYGLMLLLLGVGVARSRYWHTYAMIAVGMLALLAVAPDNLRSAFRLDESAAETRLLVHEKRVLQQQLKNTKETSRELRAWLARTLPDARRYAGLRADARNSLVSEAKRLGLSLKEWDAVLGDLDDAIGVPMDDEQTRAWLAAYSWHIERIEADSERAERRGELIRALIELRGSATSVLLDPALYKDRHYAPDVLRAELADVLDETMDFDR